MVDAALADLFAFVGFGHEVGRINCHHNFAQREEHHGRWLWITRKWAIRAARGDMGGIPGSMGTRSYIVRGLGESESYMSSSHGAGRRMSRGRARLELAEESLVEAMKDKARFDINTSGRTRCGWRRDPSMPAPLRSIGRKQRGIAGGSGNRRAD